jgi:hypothetical protein
VSILLLSSRPLKPYFSKTAITDHRVTQIDLRKYGFNIHKYDTGEIVINQATPEYSVEAPNFNGHRGELHEVVFSYAKDDLGIPSE